MNTLTSSCGWCGRPLPVDGPSPDFCGETHQREWQAARSQGRPTDAELRAQAAAVIVTIKAAMVGLQAAFDAVAKTVRTTVDAWVRAGVLPPPTPVDPKARALELRRTRNTGPADRPRPPRRIDPTRSRR